MYDIVDTYICMSHPKVKILLCVFINHFLLEKNIDESI